MRILYWVPKNLVSFVAGKLMHIQFPSWINEKLIHLFAKTYHINLNETEKPIANYRSIGDFFIRKLKEGVRPLGSSLYVHPADSAMTARGVISQNQLIQAKGKTYSLKNFLGVDSTEGWEGGFYITYYLCPTDYHRVHSPIDGWVKEIRYIPGQLWPVNDWSVTNIDELFLKNERVVVEIISPKGPMAVVFVGATNVGSIRLSIESSLRTNHTHQRSPQTWSYTENSLPVQKGQELGMFCMGSTVIIVAPPAWQELAPLVKTQTPQAVQVRSSI